MKNTLLKNLVTKILFLTIFLLSVSSCSQYSKDTGTSTENIAYNEVVEEDYEEMSVQETKLRRDVKKIKGKKDDLQQNKKFLKSEEEKITADSDKETSGDEQAQNSNTEEYDRIVENNFAKPQDSPLSTFSIDVDAASYTNARRFINNGQMPYPSAVRIEEFVNYFTYEVKNKTKNHGSSIAKNVFLIGD